MIPAKCPRCEKSVDHHGWHSDPIVVTCKSSPWPIQWTLQEGSCSHCGAFLSGATPSNGRPSFAFTARSIRLEVGRTLQPLAMPNPSKVEKNTHAIVVYHPFGNDLAVTEKIDHALASFCDDLDVADPTANRIVFIAEGIDNVWAMQNRRRLGEIYEINKSVFDDAAGPFPSLKLSLAICRWVQTQFGMNRTFMHSTWPLPAVTDKMLIRWVGVERFEDEIVKLWAQHARNNIKIETDKNE